MAATSVVLRTYLWSAVGFGLCSGSGAFDAATWPTIGEPSPSFYLACGAACGVKRPGPSAAFQAQADKALKRIAAAARSPAMKGDPYRENFIAEASMVGLMMPELVRLIHAGWAPLSDDATAALVIGKKLISASSENPAACVERSIVEPMPLSLVRPAVVSSWDA